MFAKHEDMHWPREATPVVARILLVMLPVWMVLSWLQPGWQPPRATREERKLARAEMRALVEAVVGFRDEHGRLPSMAELHRPDARGRVWTFVEETDPWGHRYWFGHAAEGYQVRTPGPDGLLQTRDDLLHPLPK